MEGYIMAVILAVLILLLLFQAGREALPKARKAKVVEKHVFVAGLTEHSVAFLLPDKTTCTLDMTKKIYDALSVGDIDFDPCKSGYPMIPLSVL